MQRIWFRTGHVGSGDDFSNLWRVVEEYGKLRYVFFTK